MKTLWDLRSATWDGSALAEAVPALLRLCGLIEGTARVPTSLHETEQNEWMERAAGDCGCEVERLNFRFANIGEELSTAYPAILDLGEGRYLAVVNVKRNRAALLAPDLKVRNAHLDEICDCLRNAAGETNRKMFEELVIATGIGRHKREKAVVALLDAQLENTPCNACWVFSANPVGKPANLLKQAAVVQHLQVMLAAHLLQAVLWIAAWCVLGKLSLEGRMDQGWVWAWTLLLLTMIPCQILTTWLQGLFTIGLGGFIKKRLLFGAMKLRPDEMRKGGIGSFLGQALEAETFETLAMSGGISGLLALVEVILAIFVLGRFGILLVCWICVMGFAGWRFLRKFRNWTDARLKMTEDLVDTMVGHRTRLAQFPPHRWHEEEDQALQNYVAYSRHMDNVGAWLIAAIPRGWLLTAVLALSPSIVHRQNTEVSTAVILGGVLLAYGALRKLTGAIADVGAACVSFERLKPLFHAAAREEKRGDGELSNTASKSCVLEAEHLSFRYRNTGKAAVQAASLSVLAGDRILVEGPSGGGKTTFASLLAGFRQPQSGLLLVHGLDRETLGDQRWRKQLAAVPQFHENHILTETLAFNLLLGRGWPPTQRDMQEAEAVCRELGLGNLLDSMPSGLMQMVGEGGWQLSHGEKSRVFLARGLLQAAEMIILDESFAALDPENGRLSLETTLKRAKTLMVIAHP